MTSSFVNCGRTPISNQVRIELNNLELSNDLPTVRIKLVCDNKYRDFSKIVNQPLKKKKERIAKKKPEKRILDRIGHFVKTNKERNI